MYVIYIEQTPHNWSVWVMKPFCLGSSSSFRSSVEDRVCRRMGRKTPTSVITFLGKLRLPHYRLLRPKGFLPGIFQDVHSTYNLGTFTCRYLSFHYESFIGVVFVSPTQAVLGQHVTFGDERGLESFLGWRYAHSIRLEYLHCLHVNHPSMHDACNA